jgi:hypothetical protein
VNPDVVQDPVFQQLLIKFDRAGRKLRDAVISMRSFYLHHDKPPAEETTQEKWKSAILSEDAAQKFHNVENAAADLLRYAYELAPHSSSPIHLEEIMKLRIAHQERLKQRMGWGPGEPGPKGIEEKVRIDCGPPVTLILRPEAYEFTNRAKSRKPASEPTSCQDGCAPEDAKDR